MIFVDAGPYIGLHNPADKWHPVALEGFAKLEASGEQLVTTSPVLHEIVGSLSVEVGFAYAASIARQLLSSQVLEIVRPTALEELDAVAVMESHAKKEVGFADAVSLVIMRKRRVDRAFSFDRAHFEKLFGLRLFHYRNPASP